jgi:hypothetical protein
MSSRKPAPIVSCEYCKWKGSARGLFTHVRLSHPGIETKPPVAKLVHPLSDRQSISGTSIKRPRKRYSSEIEKEVIDVTLTTLGIMFAIKVLQSLTPNQKHILQSEGINPSKVVTALGKIQ